VTLKGKNSSDDLNGGSGDDFLYGKKGDDTLSGEKGNDQLFGGEGDDTLAGDAGNDILHGDEGDDVFLASSEDTSQNIDYMYGDSGNDLFVFGDFQGTANVYGNNDTTADGGSWVDVIEIDVQPSTADVSGDWTLSIEGQPDQTFNPATGHGALEGGDMSGKITTDDGGTINFDDIDKIEW
jgi:Ca2+-binding RTX toxin-like protein